MKTYLQYNHTRKIFTGSEWRPGIEKWFENPEFIGCENSGNWGPVISVENYEDVRDKLPKSLRPDETALGWEELL